MLVSSTAPLWWPLPHIEEPSSMRPICGEFTEACRCGAATVSSPAVPGRRISIATRCKLRSHLRRTLACHFNRLRSPMQGPMNQRQRTPNDPMSIVRYCRRVLMNHGHLIVLFSLLLAVAGIVVVSLIPDQYKATTTILVDPQKIPERYVASTITTDLNAHMSTLTQQVLSSTRLQEVIDAEHLYPDLRPRKSREQLLDYMRSKIKIELKQASDEGISSFSISYTDKDRWQVASVTNRLASSFIDWNLSNRQQQAMVTTQFLGNELQQAKTSLEEQESALQAFRMQHIGSTPDQLNVNMQAISRLQADIQSNVDAVSRLDEERILLTQQRRVDTRDPSALSERDRLLQERSRLENDLQNLRRQYTDTYPDVVN